MNKQHVRKFTLPIIAFILGLAISRYMLPNQPTKDRASSEQFEVVPVIVVDPKLKLKEALTEIDQSKIPYSMKKSKKGFELTVEGLTPYSPEQEGIKKVLGIGSASSGNVVFDIQKK